MTVPRGLVILFSIAFILMTSFAWRLSISVEKEKAVVETYNKTRQEFIEMYKSVRFELMNKTYCYDSNGGSTREAVYKGRNLYQVKP